MARRRSPEEARIRASTTEGSTVMCSEVAMYISRLDDDWLSKEVKRNLEQRDARGSIILDVFYWHRES